MASTTYYRTDPTHDIDIRICICFSVFIQNMLSYYLRNVPISVFRN